MTVIPEHRGMPNGKKRAKVARQARYKHRDDIEPRIRPCTDYIVGEIKRLVADSSPNDPTRSLKLFRYSGAPNH